MRALPAVLLLPLILAQAQEVQPEPRFVFRFEPNASRLAGSQIEQFVKLKAYLATDESEPVMLLPVPDDAQHRRLLTARRAELDRQLSRHGLTADHQSDRQMTADGDELSVALRHSAASAPTPAMPTQPYSAAAIEPPKWNAEAGRTLRAVLADWAAQAGWSLVWQSGYDYPLEASARFDGDFPTAVAAVLKGFLEAKPPPSARFFPANQVVMIL